MDISTIFDFDGFLQAGHKPPEFSFDVILSYRPRAVEDWIEWHLVLEITLLEVCCLFLELLEGVDSSFFEAKIAVANKASWTVPIIVGLVWDLWI
jgi:hypothetical protein